MNQQPIQMQVPDIQKRVAVQQANEMQKLNNLCSYAATLFQSQFKGVLDGTYTAEDLADWSVKSARIMFDRLDEEVENARAKN